jgi:hypothetical protein
VDYPHNTTGIPFGKIVVGLAVLDGADANGLTHFKVKDFSNNLMVCIDFSLLFAFTY